jgi:23S rRNA (guanine745-N1)-methyltransferase
MTPTLYQCPLCALPLTRHATGLVCGHGHQFDRAKEGYVHLLPVQFKKSADPGDNAQMLSARREFLNAGHYGPLAKAIEQLLLPKLGTAMALLDLGCGEGYYSAQLQKVRPDLHYHAMDIAKVAVKMAAKAYPALACVVASAYQLPFQTAALDAILRIYAPSQACELARVIKPQGWLCTVTPAPEHLLNLKQRIYQQARLHPEHISAVAGFSHQQRQRLRWQWQPQSAVELMQLLAMIPLNYHITPELRQQLAQELPAMDLDFYIDLYQRDHHSAPDATD